MPTLEKRIENLERTSRVTPKDVSEMTEAELIAAIGLGHDPTDDELDALIKEAEECANQSKSD